MADMTIRDGKFVLTENVAESGTTTTELATTNTFIDKNILVEVVTPAGELTAGGTTISVTDNKDIISESPTEPSSGAYITVDAYGSATITTGGYMDENETIDSAEETKYFTFQDAAFGRTDVNIFATRSGFVEQDAVNPILSIPYGEKVISGGELTPGNGDVTTEASGYYDGESYDPTDNVTLTTTETAGYYKITSTGAGTVHRAEVDSMHTVAGYFGVDISPVVEIDDDSLRSNEATQDYYIKKSTLTADNITPSMVQQTVIISDGYSSEDRTITIEPISRTATIATELSVSGISTYFDSATQASHDVEIIPQYTNTAGYLVEHATGTNAGGTEYYDIKTTDITFTGTTISGGTITRGTAAWGTGWITGDSIPAAAFANTATSGVSYVDISDTTAAPVLVSNDYLYINEGYVDNLKISLAKLAPDTPSADLASDVILSGYSALDRDGLLVAGNIQTYDGTYTVS